MYHFRIYSIHESVHFSLVSYEERTKVVAIYLFCSLSPEKVSKLRTSEPISNRLKASLNGY